MGRSHSSKFSILSSENCTRTDLFVLYKITILIVIHPTPHEHQEPWNIACSRNSHTSELLQFSRHSHSSTTIRSAPARPDVILLIRRSEIEEIAVDRTTQKVPVDHIIPVLFHEILWGFGGQPKSLVGRFLLAEPQAEKMAGFLRNDEIPVTVTVTDRRLPELPVQDDASG